MRNRAKCKLCQSIIESFHSTDYVECKCGHIAVDGGEAMRCAAIDFNNFLRIDDEGNEIIVKENALANFSSRSSKPTKQELFDELDQMIKSYERLPQHAMHAPVTHADLCSALLLVSAVLRA